ncbi:MAG TPA: hypothetical protein VFZ58_04605 [Candidatus Saccharimonadales bacterium]
MNITAEDVSAVRSVLNGDIPLADAAERHSPQTSLLVAVTILAGAGKTSFRHGEYGKLLVELVLMGAAPANGWPTGEKGPDVPSWYDKKYYFNYICASRRRRLHCSSDRAGNNISLQLPFELRALLDEHPWHIERAIELYARAAESVEKAAEKKKRQTANCKSLMFY